MDLNTRHHALYEEAVALERHVSVQPSMPRIIQRQVHRNNAPGPTPEDYYFGRARGKGFATLRNVLKLQFFDKIGHVKSVGFRFYSAIS